MFWYQTYISLNGPLLIYLTFGRETVTISGRQGILARYTQIAVTYSDVFEHTNKLRNLTKEMISMEGRE